MYIMLCHFLKNSEKSNSFTSILNLKRVSRGRNLSCLKRGAVCVSRGLEVSIRMILFCNNIRGFKAVTPAEPHTEIPLIRYG